MSDRRRKRPRFAVAAVIAAAHAGFIALAMLANGPAPAAAEPEPIFAALLLPAETAPPPAPLAAPDMEAVVPDVVVPPLLIDIRPEETPQIAAATRPAPPAETAMAPQVTAAPPAVAEADTSTPVIATAVEYLRPPVVTYPPAARQARAEGTVHVRALVEKDGRVREVRVDRSSGFAALDKAACEAVTGALFRPYLLNGLPRVAVVIVPVDFALKSRRAGWGKDRSAARGPDTDGLSTVRYLSQAP